MERHSFGNRAWPVADFLARKQRPSPKPMAGKSQGSRPTKFRFGKRHVIAPLVAVNENAAAPALKGGLILFAFGIVLLAIVVATSAQALTVTNRSAVPQEITVIEGDEKEIIVVQPEETISDICEAGCTIQHGKGSVADFDGFEIVLIDENGIQVQE